MYKNVGPLPFCPQYVSRVAKGKMAELCDHEHHNIHKKCLVYWSLITVTGIHCQQEEGVRDDVLNSNLLLKCPF